MFLSLVAKGCDELALLPRGVKGEAATLFSLSPAAASSESWGTLGLQTPRVLPASQGRLGKPPILPSLTSRVYPKLLWLLDREEGCMFV